MPKAGAFVGILFLSLAAVAQQPTVKIRELQFPDTIGLSADAKAHLEREVKARSFQSENEVAEFVRDVLQQQGYFKATIYDAKFKRVRTSPRQTVVDASTIIYPGPQYRLASIQFSGERAFTPERMRPMFPMSDGDLFNIENARVGIKALKDLYGENGYINFTPVPDFEFDERAHVLTMKVDIDEGDRYRVGDLIVNGEESEPGAKDRLQKAWAKYKGTYRMDAIQQLFRDVHARPHLPLHDFVSMAQDNTNHVLNYEITLGKPGSRLNFAP